MQYRTDIDGLRAIAVALVVLFHFGLPVPGGFVGVDAFFVISGYLITGIVIREIEAGSFSLLSFYDRRIRRIFPALFAVIVATMIAGAFILLPGDYKLTGRSALSSSLSLANFFFYRNTGYFDPAAETMPLLHIWSLAVEEQFYIVWPALLMFLAWSFHGRRWPLVYACLAVLAASFACSVFLVQSNPKAAFFLPQSRAWELAVGAALALLPANAWTRLAPIAQPAGLAGLGLLLFGALGLNEHAPFPGINALFPVIGAALIMAPWSRPTLVQRALSVAPLVLVGKISYSLYLWHWPVLAFWKHYTGGENPSALELAALFVVALALSYVSWRWIEQPFRGRRRFSEIIVIPAGVAVASLCALLSWQIALRDGFPARLAAQLQPLASKETMWKYPCAGVVAQGPAKGLCTVGLDWDSAATRGILWGESHAEHLLPLVHLAALQANTSIALVRECPPIIRAGGVQRRGEGPRYSENCARRNAATEAMLRASPDIKLVLLSWVQRYGGYHYPGQEPPRTREAGLKLLRDSISDLVSNTATQGRKVVVLGNLPRMPLDPVPCVLSEQGLLRRPCHDSFQFLPRAAFDVGQRDVLEAVRAAASDHPQAVAHMLTDYVCDATRCLTYLNGEFLYRDASHLRRNLTTATATALMRLLKLDTLLGSLQPGAER